ncbi:BON domain-containing protein [Ideonella margarita]|uniref:BON domain-containing protein n=1 Tax=Ideonella margarita TaxID=2984191 RepID=A0ABU9C6B6_9BURK
MNFRRSTLLALLAASATLTACAPLLVGSAAVSGAMLFTDRRTSGAQLEDQSIEIKGLARAKSAAGDRGHLNVTSYNRVALITGEVPTDADRAAVEQALTAVDNVRSVVNEVGVMPNSALTTRSNDSLITGKVKATLVDAKDVQANAFKVVTERGTVYLLGRVTEREASRAVELTRTIAGVQKVVRVFETLTEDELKALTPK